MKTKIAATSLALFASLAFAGASLAQAAAPATTDHMSSGDHTSASSVSSHDSMSSGAMASGHKGHMKKKAHSGAMSTSAMSPSH